MKEFYSIVSLKNMTRGNRFTMIRINISPVNMATIPGNTSLDPFKLVESAEFEPKCQ